MESSKATRVLAKVKANWPRLPVDELVDAEWCERLASVGYADAIAVVCEFADSGREEPPTPGMIHRAAMAVASRREEQERRKLKLIEAPPPTEEERQNFKQLLDDFVAKAAHSRAAGGIAAFESTVDPTGFAAAGKIDPETERAQKVILEKRREIKRERSGRRGDGDGCDNGTEVS